MYQPNNQKVGIIKAKANKIFNTEETAFFNRELPLRTLKNQREL
jgi:hypothetical protein